MSYRGAMITGARARSVTALLAAALFAAATLAGCGFSADAGAPSVTNAKLASPLPGSDAAGARLGIITSRSKYLTLELPGRFSGLTDEQISALTASIARVGDRSVTVLSTPMTVGVAVEGEPTRHAAKACTEQKGSSIVITDVADAGLVDCLIGNGSVVIDASAQPWDEQALARRAPFLWASATATADVAERALLAQAKTAGLLPTGPATIVTGPDETTQRVAAAITSPGLIAQGLAPQTITVEVQAPASPGSAQQADLAPVIAAAQQASKAGRTGIVRPLTPSIFALLASEESFSSANSKVLVTSTSSPRRVLSQSSVRSPSIGARTWLLGWAPPSDGTALVDTPNASGDEETAAACQAALGKQSPPQGQQEAWPSLYRMCDATNLARAALNTTGAPTAAGVRDAIWNTSSAWQPAAVTASGWTPNTYTGANIARWFAWNPNCRPAAVQDPTGCFAPTGAPIPLQPTG